MANPLKVVFLIDALGWRIAERFGFCRELFEKRAPLDTVLGYSSAAIPSLLSGTTPSEHGAWAMWRRADEGRSPFRYLRYVPKLPHALDWRVRNLVRRFTNRRRLIDGYYDLYEIPVHLLARFDVAQHKRVGPATRARRRDQPDAPVAHAGVIVPEMTVLAQSIQKPENSSVSEDVIVPSGLNVPSIV